MNPCISRGLRSLFASLSESPFVKASGGHHSEACLLSVPRAAAAFLPLSFIKQKKMQGCLCVLQRRKTLSRQVALRVKVDGVSTEEL